MLLSTKETLNERSDLSLPTGEGVIEITSGDTTQWAGAHNHIPSLCVDRSRPGPSAWVGDLLFRIDPRSYDDLSDSRRHERADDALGPIHAYEPRALSYVTHSSPRSPYSYRSRSFNSTSNINKTPAG